MVFLLLQSEDITGESLCLKSGLGWVHVEVGVRSVGACKKWGKRKQRVGN